ncbi:MAG: 4-alpha-glucanotransferase [Lachnospiraceae bacterium]|jgi:4-alpha-glucanotransferase|nr:4-alpha-glucanotransferase [Lachnospiraceae bacterium]
MRASGILLPVSSIPSAYGIGSFSKEAYEFVDFLEKAGQSYWQILPLGPTGYGDSPYQSFSTFAGNPYYIDFEELIEEGLLTKEQCEECDWGGSEAYVDYEKIYKSRFRVLKEAFDNSRLEDNEGFQAFVAENAFWLSDYSLYMAVKDSYKGKSWSEWDGDIRLRKPEAIEKYAEKLKEEILFYEFQQYLFDTQWRKLKKYANDKGVKIIGDIPIYVALDSADTWANPELFQLDENRRPTGVAGCPPDAFSATGQLWGNPLYKWDYHKETEYAWWIQRISYCYKLYDVVRIDHFRGFDEYYNIPFGDTTAEFGRWEKGPGYDLFKVMKKKIGNKPVIAEDLGFLTPTVNQLLKKSGYPGMKVLQFSFDSREESDYLPHNYTANSVVYTGTHDNDTTVGWYQTISRRDRSFARKYLNIKTGRELEWNFIRAALGSVSDTAVIPMQDYLGLGSEARINVPSTLGTNWKWRMTKGQIPEGLAEKIYDLCKLYGRVR